MTRRMRVPNRTNGEVWRKLDHASLGKGDLRAESNVQIDLGKGNSMPQNYTVLIGFSNTISLHFYMYEVCLTTLLLPGLQPSA